MMVSYTESGNTVYESSNVMERTENLFGQHVLVNVSMEKETDEKLSGYLRNPSKTQGDMPPLKQIGKSR